MKRLQAAAAVWIKAADCTRVDVIHSSKFASPGPAPVDLDDCTRTDAHIILRKNAVHSD